MRLVNKRQLADYLSVSQTTVGRMADRGDLPKPLRLGPGVVRWDLQKIDGLIDSFSDASEYDDPDLVLLQMKERGK